MLPMGAPRPLLKQRETESKREVYDDERGVEVETATSQMRAPSRCSFMLLLRAKVEMGWITGRGMRRPLRVFSREITEVGCVVDVGADDGGGGDVRECEVVVVGGCDGCDLGAGDRGDSAGFVDVDV